MCLLPLEILANTLYPSLSFFRKKRNTIFWWISRFNYSAARFFYLYPLHDKFLKSNTKMWWRKKQIPLRFKLNHQANGILIGACCYARSWVIITSIVIASAYLHIWKLKETRLSMCNARLPLLLSGIGKIKNIILKENLKEHWIVYA